MNAIGCHITRTYAILGACQAKPWSPALSTREKEVGAHKGSLLRVATKLSLILLALTSGSAAAQVVIPFIQVDSASVFEGNSGTTILTLPVSFVVQDPNGGPPVPVINSTTVTGLVSAVPLSGNGFIPATGGAICGGSVDFVQFINVPFSIPANFAGTPSVNIAVCGDTVIEPNENIFVSFSEVSGALLGETSVAIGTIINDDGPPGISVQDLSLSLISGFGTTAKIPVRLNHPSTTSTTVHFATRDGTAKARTTSNLGSYIGTSGTLTILPNTLSSNINVTILSSGAGTFFVDLSNPVNGTIVDGTGQCTIKRVTLIVGAFDLSPDDLRVPAGQTVNYKVGWTVPPGEVWRDLKTLDFRLRQGHKVALWVHWDQAGNTFDVCRKTRNRGNADDGEDADSDLPADVDCGPAVVPGSPVVLGTPYASLYMRDVSVVGSGPTGPSVTLNLPISFGPKAAGHYKVELAAADDLGNQDDFVEAGDVLVVGEQAEEHVSNELNAQNSPNANPRATVSQPTPDY
jgi:hypothetical protein